MTNLPFYVQFKPDRDIADIFSFFANEPNAVFLDSAMSGRPNSRYSFFGFSPRAVFQSRDGLISIGRRTYIDDPVRALKEFLSKTYSLPRDPYHPFYAGLVGYIGFEWALADQAKKSTKDHATIPDAWFGFYDTIVTCDHVEGVATISSIGLKDDWTCDSGLAEERCNELLAKIKGLPRDVEKPTLRSDEPVELYNSNTYEEYFSAVRSIQQQIKDGICSSASLSQRFHAYLKQSPWAIHSKLRSATPAPYAAYLNCGPFSVLTTSSTSFLQLNDAELVGQPVLTSRSRPTDSEADKKILKELQNTIAQNGAVIVESELDHLSLVTEQGSVKLSPPVIESDPRSHRIVSTINARIAKDKDIVDCLAACMPASSMSGTPKLKTASVITEHEPVKRQVYTGAIGYIGLNGRSQFNVAVRTLLVRDSVAYLHTSAPVDLEMDPKRTYDRMRQTANELLTAIGHSPIA